MTVNIDKAEALGAIFALVFTSRVYWAFVPIGGAQSGRYLSIVEEDLGQGSLLDTEKASLHAVGHRVQVF